MKIKQIQKAINVLKKSGFSVRREAEKIILEFNVSSKEGEGLIRELEQEIDKEIRVSIKRII